MTAEQPQPATESLDVAQRGLMARLAEETAVYRKRQEMADAARKRRDLLIVKLLRDGVTTRTVGAVVGISSSGISQLHTRWTRANDGSEQG